MTREFDLNPLPAWLCLFAGWLLASTQLGSRRPHPLDLASRIPAPLRAAPSPDPDRMPPRDLRRLPGIGERRALAIARARWDQGLRGGPESWDAIPGIGPETVRRVRAFLEPARRDPSDP